MGLDRNYNIKLDLQFRCSNTKMKFSEFDNNTSDFFVRITNSNKLIDLHNAIVLLAVVKPDNTVDTQYIDVEGDLVHAELKPGMKSIIGTYKAQAMLVYKDNRVVTEVFEYEVIEESILGQLNTDVQEDERYTLLTDMLSRLSVIELNEESRIENFAKIVNEFNTIKAEFNELVYVKVDERVDEVIVPIVSDKVEDLTKEVIADLNDRVTIADKKILEVDDKIVEVNANMDTINTTFNNKVNQVDETISNANTEVDKMKTDVNAKISEVNTAKNTMVSKVDNKIVEVNNTQNNLTNTVDNKIVEVNTKVDSKIQEVDGAKVSMTNTVNNKITEVNNATSNMNKQLSNKVTEVSSKITEVNTAKNTMVTDVNNKINQANTTINDVETRFNALAPDQSTNAEVQLARTDASGVTHNSLHERLVKAETSGLIMWETVEG